MNCFIFVLSNQNQNLKKMKQKAILINVETKQLTQIIIDKDISSISEAIGNGCELFCVPVDYENGDALYADDESLLRLDDIKGGFIFPNWNFPIINNAIILGTDDEGDSIDCKSTIEEIQKDITFISEEKAKIYAEKASGMSFVSF